MKDIIKIIKLDLISIRPYYTLKNLLILFGLSFLYGLLSKNGLVAYGVASIFTLLFATYPFLVGEESGIDSLYAAFGIKRKKVVLGRYIWGHLIILMSLLVGSFLAGIITIVLKKNFYALEHLYSIIGVFVFSGIIISIQYPLFFKYGYKKAKTVVSGLFTLIAVLIFALGYFRESVKGVIGFVINYPYLLVATVLLIWILVNFTSIKLSIDIYKNRDLV